MKKAKNTQAHIEQLLICFEHLLNEESITKNTNFMPALIARCLYSAKHIPAANTISKNIIDNLLKERSVSWTWNYNVNKITRKYPDDLDDTFCTLHAISLWNVHLIKNEAYAHIVKTLIANESETGGPYRTWIISSDQWNEVDPWVNANIGAFFASQSISLEKLEAYFNRILADDSAKSKYYTSNFSLYYFLSFWYKGYWEKICEELILKQRKDGSWGDLISTAFAACTMIRVGGNKSCIKKAIRYIRKNSFLLEDNHFYIERIEGGKIIYAESKSLTIALCIEALSLFLSSFLQDYTDLDEMCYVKKVRAAAGNIIESLPKSMLPLVLNYMDFLLSYDMKNEIILLPYHASQKLSGLKVSDDSLIGLSVANIFGWCAYAIYDQYIDSGNKEGIPLSFANIFNREMILIYKRLKLDDFILQSVLNRVDHAYCLEQTSLCKKEVAKAIPDHAIFNKSIGHALPIISILNINGYEYSSPEVQACIGFFEKYLFIRQLSDDAHDWKDDLEQGTATQITQRVLIFENKLNHTCSRERIFWEKVSLHIAYKILTQAQKAEEAIGILEKLFKDKMFFLNLINPYRKIAHDIINEHRKMLEFIRGMNEK